MKPLKLEVLFGSRDNLSPALKLMIGSSNAASKALKATRDQLKQLNDQQDNISSYKKFRAELDQTISNINKYKQTIQDLKKSADLGPLTKSQIKDFNKAESELKKLNVTYEKQVKNLTETVQHLNQAGMSVKSLGQDESDLKHKVMLTTIEYDKQTQALKRLDRVRETHNKMSGNVRTAAMAGAGMAATGSAALFAMRKPIDESKSVDVEQNRIASLGFGKKATEEAIQYARAMKTFGTSTLDNLTLVRDGVTAFGDVHHAQWVAPTLAKMKFANEAMYGDHGVENEKKFMDMLKVIEMRNGLKSKESFQEQANIIQQVITATGGRVQAEEWLNVIKTGGIAAKGMDNKAFYYKMEPLVQEMGGHRVGTSMMSAYQNLYQGRTTQRAANNLDKLGLIGDYSKVHHNKTGDLSYLDIGAIKGADLFKKDQFAWMEKVLVPALNAKGITKESDVIDAIGSIFSNRTASNLFAQMYMQRDQIHKNAKLNEGAFNIDQLNTQAQGTTAGKELEARAKLHDAYLQFGQTILPIYTQALIMASTAMQSFTGWMQQNPTLAKALGTGLLVIAGGLVALGGLLVVFSPLILSMLSLRLMMATLGVQGSALSFVFKMLTSPLQWLGKGILWLGQMFMVVGRFMLANPIILAITLLATAAYLIYQNWEPIKAFFIDLWASISNGATQAWSWVSTQSAQVWSDIQSIFSPIGQWFTSKWQEIKTAFSGGIAGVSALILNWSPMGLFYSAFSTVLNWFGFELPTKFSEFGANVINGLINGIKSTFPKLKEIWNEVANYMPDWLKQRMIIRSPSRVMAGLGGHIVSGIGMGLTQAFPELKNKYNQVLNLFTNKTQSPVMDHIDIAAPVISKIQKAPNLTPSRQSSVAMSGDTYTIHIHAAPGQNVQNLERQIEQVVMRIQRDKLARVRTAMADQE